MNKTRPPQTSPDRSYNPDDEIGIITLLKFLWKWKILILSVTLLCALAGLVASLFMTKIYRIDTLMEEVVVGIKPNGEQVYLGTGPSIKSAIDSGRFNEKILTSLGQESKDALPRRLSFKVSLENSNHFIRVAYETSDVKLGEKILSRFPNLLKDWSLGPIESWRKDVSKKILQKQIEIDNLEMKIGQINQRFSLNKLGKETRKLEVRLEARLEREMENREREKRMWEKESFLFKANAEIDGNKTYIKYAKQKLDEITTDIATNENYIALLLKKSKEMLSKKTEDKNLFVISNVSQAIEQGFEVLETAKESARILEANILNKKLEIQLIESHIKNLRREIAELNNELAEPGSSEPAEREEEREFKTTLIKKQNEIRQIEDQLSIDGFQSEIRNEERKIKAIREEINGFETDKKNVKNIQVLQPPTVNTVPLRPKTERIVGIAAAAGFFLSLFLALAMEFSAKNKKREYI